MENHIQRLYSDQVMKVPADRGHYSIGSHYWGQFKMGVGPRKDSIEPEDFRLPKFDCRGEEKKSTEVEIYKLSPGRFVDVFALFNKDLDDLTFNQGQIGSFCYDYPGVIERDLLFLFKSSGAYHVASVFSYQGFGLRICANPFNMERPWSTRDMVVAVPVILG